MLSYQHFDATDIFVPSDNKKKNNKKNAWTTEEGLFTTVSIPVKNSGFDIHSRGFR